jgi:hypothetical protein
MRQLNRRDLLVSLGSSGILAMAGSYGGKTRPVFAQATCTLTPQQTEGPYWFDARQVRRDITEGKPGVPLRLLLRVVGASTCLPIPNALAEIWHCDAAGIYSGILHRARQVKHSCAAFRQAMPMALSNSKPSIPVGIAVGRRTSISRYILEIKLW